MRQILASELEAGMVLRDTDHDGAAITEVIVTMTGARRILRLSDGGKIAFRSGESVLIES